MLLVWQKCDRHPLRTHVVNRSSVRNASAAHCASGAFFVWGVVSHHPALCFGGIAQSSAWDVVAMLRQLLARPNSVERLTMSRSGAHSSFRVSWRC